MPSSGWHTDGTLANGSVVAYYRPSPRYGNDKIAERFGGCSTGSTPGTATAPGYSAPPCSITIGQNFGSLTAVSPDTRFGMGPRPATPTWGSGCQHLAAISPNRRPRWAGRPSRAPPSP